MRKYQGKLTVIYDDFRVLDSSNPSVKRQERDFEKSESLLIFWKTFLEAGFELARQ